MPAPPADPVERRDALEQHRKAIDQWIGEVWSYRGGLSVPERILRFLIPFALKVTGLYQRGRNNADQPMLRETTISISGLPAAFEGYRILHLGDFHFDGRPEIPERIAALIDPIHVDLAVFTGDCPFEFDTPVDAIVPGMKTVFDAVHAGDGLFACLGNNDTYNFVEATQGIGVRWLYNEGVAIHRGDANLWIAGTDDPHKYECADLESALYGCPADAVKVLIVHTPEITRQARDAGLSLYLCGHTHGGQICLPGGIPLFRNGPIPLAKMHGAWRESAMAGHTTAGLGCTAVQVRYNCPPEAVLITLERA